MRALLRVTGGAQHFASPLPLDAIRALLGAEYLDTVCLHHMGPPLHVMCVDDLGHRKGLPVNIEATRLYWRNRAAGTDHVIRGDVFIAPDDDFASESRPL